jgi:hypothetical protein
MDVCFGCLLAGMVAASAGIGMRHMVLTRNTPGSGRARLIIAVSLACFTLPLGVLAAVTALRGSLLVGGLGLLGSGILGAGLGWFVGPEFRVLPEQSDHYSSRFRGRRTSRRLRQPEVDLKPPEPNPFLDPGKHWGGGQPEADPMPPGPNPFRDDVPPPPGVADPGNPFANLDFTDEPQGGGAKHPGPDR